MINLVYAFLLLSVCVQLVSLAVPVAPTSSAPITPAKAIKTENKEEVKKETKAKEVKKKGPLAACKEDETRYIYTPCDEHGDRWRILIPKTQCGIVKAEVPIPGMKCSVSCKPGEYMDVKNQKCAQCAAGEYSVGDGKRYSNWDTIPEGFSTRGYSNGDSPTPGPGDEKSEDDCKEARWKPKGDYLESNGSSCRSVLKYIVELDTSGNITFAVKSGDESSLFHVWIENELSCASTEYDTSDYNKYFQVTNEWRVYTMPLHQGRNIVYFLAANFENNYGPIFVQPTSTFSSDSGRSTLLKEITVRGFSSAYDCDICQGGTYSPPASSYCSSCPENTYSKDGAGRCIACSAEEYSGIAYDRCVKREPCRENDYYMVWEPCKDGKTHKTFKWKEPFICSTTHKDSVKLPGPSEPLTCPGCNPGQFINGSDCSFCPKDQYSNGNQGCVKCPPNTRGAPGLFYKYWTRYPGEPMHLYCIARPVSGCSTSKGWMVHEEYMDTGSGHADDAELILVITVPEFTKERNDFVIDFAIECPLQQCRFKIELMESDSSLHTIRTYEGHQERTTFTHVRHTSSPARYRLVFEKKYVVDQQTYKYTDSRLKIYFMSITNALLGGTSKCEACESHGKGCVTCEPGSYIGKTACIPCPRNTYLENQDNPVGIISCKACPEGTVSEPGSTFCHSNCLVKGTGGQVYNLTALSGEHIINGRKRFTTKGYMYYHQFKGNLCGKKFVESVCDNNATNLKDNFVKAALCRSTIIPDKNMVVSAQSINIGNVLKKVEVNSVRAQKDNTSTIQRSHADEIRFIFHSDRTTEVCKQGTYGIIRLVCDAFHEPAEIELGDGKGCKSETCDGCNYTFTYRSKHACPTCVPRDIEIINTACSKGVKRTHYVWKQPHVCFDTGDIKPIDTESECSIFEKSILDFKVIIFAFLLGGVLLAIVVLYLCYRNRSLSYKYHRLIDASQTKDGELPASEMCALEDGEEEEEEILVRTKGGGSKIIDRLRGIGKKKKDFSEFETINLDSIHYSEDDDEI